MMDSNLACLEDDHLEKKITGLMICFGTGKQTYQAPNLPCRWHIIAPKVPVGDKLGVHHAVQTWPCLSESRHQGWHRHHQKKGKAKVVPVDGRNPKQPPDMYETRGI